MYCSFPNMHRLDESKLELTKQYQHALGSCLFSLFVFVHVFQSVVTCSLSLWRSLLVPWIGKLDWLEGGCNLGAVRYEQCSRRGWLVISNQRCLIGIWLRKRQTILLIHPSRISSLAVKKMWDKALIKKKVLHTFYSKWLLYSRENYYLYHCLLGWQIENDMLHICLCSVCVKPVLRVWYWQIQTRVVWLWNVKPWICAS